MDRPVTGTKESIITAVDSIGAEIASLHASEVDKNARFPIETIDALKKAKVLSAPIASELGGANMNIIESALLCKSLARHCSSSAMILGMHFIKVHTINHFAQGNADLQSYLTQLAEEQRLVASVTSEKGVGGNMRNSITAIKRDGERFKLTKNSSCMSYGGYADDLLITCRRTEESAASDQAIVLAIGDDFTVVQQGEWDPMGMRGTCSPPFDVHVDAETAHILHEDFAYVAARTMVPETHIIWAHIWLGIATEAAHRARKFIQGKARKDPSKIPDEGKALSELEINLDRFRDTVAIVSQRYYDAHIENDDDFITSMPFSIKINGLKLNSSQLCADICMRALTICGFAGFLNNTPFSIGRLLRDSLSAAPMVGNGRLLETNAGHLMLFKGE